MPRRRLLLITPALAGARNGNSQTAVRWARMLAAEHSVSTLLTWRGEAADGMIALHARRSATSIAAWAERHPMRPLIVVLTGTDLYRDIRDDPAAQKSLALAHRLVVLNDLGIQSLPVEHRHKAVICLQSASERQALIDKPARWLRAVVVGHLRDEKSPLTVMAVARLLAGRKDIRIDHIGSALDAGLGREATTLAASQATYRWLGDRSHAEVRRRIQQAHVLVHPSRMEGGAHVVIEALRCGTPVLASAIDGNLGLLGSDWPAQFPVDDVHALQSLLVRTRDDPVWLQSLQNQALALSSRFAPERERDTVRSLVTCTFEAATAS